ncbi:MAG: alanine racemase [Acidobacteria bacterium]|nr:alanine racemase [Acidobacteriota bacterium]
MRRREFLYAATGLPLLGTEYVVSGFGRDTEGVASGVSRKVFRRSSAQPTEFHAGRVERLKAEATSQAEATSSSFDPWVEINAANLRYNVAEISRRVGGRPILAVIKNNGYGTGVANIAKLLEPLRAVEGLAVVKLQEAIAVRDAGVRKPVLLMGPFDERDLEEALARGITPMVYTPIGDTLDRLAARRQLPIEIHICIDTGIGRVGVPYREAAGLIEDLARRRSVRIDGVMMTFTEHPEFDKEQLSRFTTLCSGLQAKGIRLGRRHAASSFALFQHPEGFLDMVRPGMAVYGVYPDAPFRTMGVMQLRPVVALRCRVAYVKQLQKGDSAGYERAFMPSQPTWVATLPIGHADGWPRAAARAVGPSGSPRSVMSGVQGSPRVFEGGKVKLGTQMYPVVASVSASHTIVEIGAEPRVTIGDVATCFDWNDGTRPEDVAASCGASVYDLMMHLGQGLPRKIV